MPNFDCQSGTTELFCRFMKNIDRLNRSLDIISKAFSKELRRIEKLTGIKPMSIWLSLYRLNMKMGREWEAKLWRATRSNSEMRKWIEETREEAQYSEEAFLELAQLLPKWAKRSLSEIAHALPASHGGKRRVLRFRDRAKALRWFKELTEGEKQGKKLSKTKAYEKIAREMKVSPHTIRIICDPRERERSRAPKEDSPRFEISFETVYPRGSSHEQT